MSGPTFEHIRFLLSSGLLQSSPLSKGDIWAHCWSCIHAKLSEVSSSPLLSSTWAVRLPALWSCGPAASVWPGHMHLPRRGSEVSGNVLMLVDQVFPTWKKDWPCHSCRLWVSVHSCSVFIVSCFTHPCFHTFFAAVYTTTSLFIVNFIFRHFKELSFLKFTISLCETMTPCDIGDTIISSRV